MNLNPTEFIQPSLNQKKTELENRRQDIVEGFLLRSQANWHENGESCSEYLCKLEKQSSNIFPKEFIEIFCETI
jgi:hypothetical protein